MGHPATPSRACEPCRAKRRKCDLKVPECSQCSRAHINCPGYRDTFSLRIRDQTTTVAQKVQARKDRDTVGVVVGKAGCAPCMRSGGRTSAIVATRRSGPSAPQPVPDSALISSTVHDLTPENSHQNLHIAGFPVHPEVLAINYYMNSYAPVGSFDYLPELYQTLDQSELLEHALLAPSFILFSQNVRLSTFRRLAYSHYAEALRQVNSVLSNAQLATLDTTLLAVLLLGLFEALVLQRRQTPTGWDAHIQGSLTLLRLRGPRQFESHLGRRLFLHAYGNVMSSYAQMRIKAPAELKSLQNHFARSVDPTHSILRLEVVLDGLANIRADIENASALNKLQEVLDLEDQVVTILSHLEWQAPFEVVDSTVLVASANAYHNRVYRYASQRSARRWNVLRILRLFLNEQIYDLGTQCVSEGLPVKEWSPLLENARLRAEEAISGILHSIPFALELSESPLVSARPLIYLLSSIAVSKLSPPSATAFARNRLVFLGSEYGLVQATESANMVLQSRDLEDWVRPSLVS